MAIFPTFIFSEINARKMSFTIFQNEKTPFQAIKTRNSNSPKIAILPTFFFFAVQARKMSFTIFYNKKTPFQAIRTRSSKRQKIDIFPKGLTQGFGPKMAIFLSFFLGNTEQKNVFYDIVERKKAFLGYKNKKFKKSLN